LTKEKRMSWSLQRIGKPAVVAVKVAEDVARIKCSEPEESIKNLIGSAISKALAAFPEGMPVRVEASGSQSSSGPDQAANSLSVKIEPIWGFLE
jgi:hypothetical protein